MMGHREKLKSGDEFDALTKGKKFHRFRPGGRRSVKRRFNKRVRKLDKPTSATGVEAVYTFEDVAAGNGW